MDIPPISKRLSGAGSKASATRRGRDALDAIVIGGGFYGCEVALELRRIGFDQIVLIEREPGLLRRASFVNQARVHGGYHYPRSYTTALKSRKNFTRFVAEYDYAVTHGLEKYYAMVRGSRVSADQFEVFCHRIGAFCRQAPREIADLFERGTLDRVFLVTELAFDSVKIRKVLEGHLRAAGIDVRLNSSAVITGTGDRFVEVSLPGETLRSRWVFNCTYAALDTVGVDLRTRIKRELTEMVLLVPPMQLEGRGITVIDGPFFSVMPFPPAGLHSLSHVRYTPHEAISGPEGSKLRPVKSNANAIVRDSARYMPCLSRARIERSIYEIKAVLIATERDDARPILAERNPGNGRILSVLGSKIDNIYEVREFLRNQTW
ncbi:FAD-dependent oxidoreductase [Bradyrhizobium sp. CB82]|uniref:FAD-dependent oxidoreductase n=1 Tax=Bradyrhizobium sp. CB82 TaxID=3039159 RepID=UPI0024B1A8D9|nr:FAD-dependent oxidoreductase [Bradyrhizobium sp. CB82]WFU38849.1 FAD-dependent oxidoreductase [Bradyrhizobium sp. CB82]